MITGLIQFQFNMVKNKIIIEAILGSWDNEEYPIVVVYKDKKNVILSINNGKWFPSHLIAKTLNNLRKILPINWTFVYVRGNSESEKMIEIYF